MSRLNKTEDIIKLAMLFQNSYCGLCIDDIKDTFECSRRSAERMKSVLFDLFTDKIEEVPSNDKKKRWRFIKGTMNTLISFTADDFANLEYLKGLSEVSLKDVIRTLDYGKYCAVNLNHVVNPDRFITGNTIEFRCPNGTLDATIWQNNVNLFTKLLRYATSKDFDEDTINRRWEQIKDKFTDLRWYDEIYLSQALELCDLIFDNNLDKVYFLKQYLKSFATVDKRIGKAKPFTLRK